MQKDNKFMEDMARLASGAAGGFMDLKRDMEAMVSASMEKLMRKMNFVTREEFDALQGMIAKCREEQEKINIRLDKIERR